MPLRLVTALVMILATPAGGAPPAQAGFSPITTPDGVEVGIWYPAVGMPTHQRIGLYAQDVVAGGPVPRGRHPLVVISHGTGGSSAGHVDTAVALAKAGFVVAALTHPGDNWRDNGRATRIEDRPVALRGLISYMLATWPGRASIDPHRIGAFGFSAGGFTVLAAAGGRPDLARIEQHCAGHPTVFVCTLLQSQPRPAALAWPTIRDRRIKALVIAAPALGFTFDRAGLADVRMPVQLWRADQDAILPAPYHADAVRAALPNAPEFHVVAGAGHFDFLAPCVAPAIMPSLCRSAPGFDRLAFHAAFNAAVVCFFSDRLGRR